MSDRSFLRFAFLARNAVAADGGVNIANAFMTATAVPTFTAWDRVTVVGEYQFARVEQAKAHTFEVECLRRRALLPSNFRRPKACYRRTRSSWLAVTLRVIFSHSLC